MVVAVKPQTGEIGTLLLIAAAVIVGVIAVIVGHWVVVAAMMLVVLGQGLNFRRARATRRARETAESA
jgi:CHASE2 domain-containing sensor protein